MITAKIIAATILMITLICVMYGAFDEVIIDSSEYKKFQDMVDFMKDVELYKMTKE